MLAVVIGFGFGHGVTAPNSNNLRV
jgi:hypothetical protein